MKNWGFFFGGVATGVVLTILLAVVIAHSNANLSGVTNFDQPGQIVDESSVKVLQVIGDNAALVLGQKESIIGGYHGPVYMLRNSDGKYYYDGEIINKPASKVFRQTGVYKYDAKSGDYKTVAIIEIQ